MKRRMYPRVLSAAATALVAGLAFAQAQEQGFSDCRGLVFSTEEDFVSPLGERHDGNPVISDGDLLAFLPGGNVAICARNAELLRTGVLLEVEGAMGLDAVDVIDARAGIIAFSTELDEPFGIFGHGDILFPDGTIIPNAVLVANHPLRSNAGLDAVHFVGPLVRIREAIKLAREIGPEKLREDPRSFIERLKEFEVDIWFSVEGTSEPPNGPAVLDGDLLSVFGGKVAPQNVMLSPPIPAGILDRGVDFGVDAVTADRRGNRERIQFSTEILYRGRPKPFTDGDVLKIGGSIDITNETLVAPFKPRARFLGLDALSLVRDGQTGMRPHIDTLCGDAFAAFDFATDGLWRANFATMAPGDPPRRPCGLFVPIGGTLPIGLSADTGTLTRFRVTFESLEPGTPLAGGIETKWRIRTPLLGFCTFATGVTLSTDANGWMDAADFVAARDGDPAGPSGDGSLGCANPHLRLAVWDTKALPNDRENDLMQIRLEWETTGSGGPVASTNTFNVQLDNILPQMPPYPGNLEVRLNDGSGTKVPACGEAPSGQSVFQVWSEFDDEYYWFFNLRVEGGDPPISPAVLSPSGDARHEYFETPDGPGPMGPLKNTDPTGTIGLGLVHLRNIDMAALFDKSFKRCCYLLRIRVYDAAIRHTFGGINPSSSLDLNDTVAITTFEAGG